MVLVRYGHASVICRKNNDSVLFQSEFLQLRSDAGQAFIRCLKHAGKLNVVLLLFHPPDARILMCL